MDNPTSIPGIVKDGVIVPQTNSELPEGAHVEIILEPRSVSAKLQEELDAWDHASDEAWDMIDKWEAEDQ
jgi:hypothetical protein